MLRYACVLQGITWFYLPPTWTIPAFTPSHWASPLSGQYQLILLGEHSCEKLAQGFYAVMPSWDANPRWSQVRPCTDSTTSHFHFHFHFWHNCCSHDSCCDICIIHVFMSFFGFLYMGCTLAPLANTTAPRMCGCDAALCQITSTTCSTYISFIDSDKCC